MHMWWVKLKQNKKITTDKKLEANKPIHINGYHIYMRLVTRVSLCVILLSCSFQCYPDCIYRETGSLIDGDIHMEAVKNFLQNNIEQRDKIIVPTIVESFRTCMTNSAYELWYNNNNN